MTRRKCSKNAHLTKKHKAKPKAIVQGDQVLLKQQKTTTQPLYNPQPFIVTNIEGNRLTLKNGETTRIRDKNKVKVIPQRSPIFSRRPPIPSAAPESDIDIDMRKIRSNPVNTTPQPAVTVQQTEPSHMSSSQELDEQPYHPSEEMNSHLLQLLSAAEARATPDVVSVQSPSLVKQNQRMTRSRGIKLAWNPVMNASQTLVESNREENAE